MKEIWDTQFKIKHNNNGSVPFEEFFKYLANYFTLSPNTEGYHFLKQALRMASNRSTGQPDPTEITLNEFKIVCELFRFSKAKDEVFIKRIVELFKQEWFYGFPDRKTTQEILAKAKASGGLMDKLWHNNKTPYLVRYSLAEKQFVISYYDETSKKEKFTHASIPPTEAWLKQGYVNYVDNFVKKQHTALGLFHREQGDIGKTFKH